MNIIYKMLYRLSPRKYEDVMIDEYVKNIPEDTLKPTVTVLYDYKKKLVKLNDFLAYQLHRRMANDPKNTERYQGMLVQMKLYMLMIEYAKKQKNTETAKTEEAQTKWYDQAVEGVKKFVSGDKVD